jgi:hypothetical protein
MCTVAKAVVHSATGACPEDVGNLRRRGRVVEFRDEGQVFFEDGTAESGITHCILATGYEMAFPFLSEPTVRLGLPPPSPPLPPDLWNSSYHLFPLAKHMFPLQTAPPSMAFMGIPIKSVPFPLVEAQAHAIVHVFAHPESLDASREAVDIITRSGNLRQQFGDNPSAIAKAWHVFKGLESFDYRDGLYEFVQPDVGQRNRVSAWEKEMYEKKRLLRSIWWDMVRTGEADTWVEGVGKNGPGEWVELLRRMLRRGEQRKIQNNTGDNTKL